MRSARPIAEPVLRAEDHRWWDVWMRTWAEHARTRAFMRAVDSAKRVIEEAVEKTSSAKGERGIAWSGGKDSTALVHLACVEMGMRDVFSVRSEKDDLDYPGEREYVEGLASAWGLRLQIFEPPSSPSAWIEARTGRMSGADEIHSRTSGLSRELFYPVTEQMDTGLSLVMMGLRTEESPPRAALRASRGRLYRMRSGPHVGQWRAIPIADWRGNDVFAYLVSRGVEPLHVYRCIGFFTEHQRAPWLVRKSWWLPGSSASQGAMSWLRRYYPSLWRQARVWFPDVDQMS